MDYEKSLPYNNTTYIKKCHDAYIFVTLTPQLLYHAT